MIFVDGNIGRAGKRENLPPGQLSFSLFFRLSSCIKLVWANPATGSPWAQVHSQERRVDLDGKCRTLQWKGCYLWPLFICCTINPSLSPLVLSRFLALFNLVLCLALIWDSERLILRRASLSAQFYNDDHFHWLSFGAKAVFVASAHSAHHHESSMMVFWML